MARFSFKLPDIGEGIAEAEIVAWHVAVGDSVAEDDPLCDVMTDKATVEMTAPVSGRVIAVAGAIGDMVPIGAVLAVFETEADEPALSAGGEGDHAQNGGGAARQDAAPEVEGRPVRAASGDAETRPSRPLPVPEPVPDTPEPNGNGGGKRRILASPAVRARARDLGIDLAEVRGDGERIRHGDLDAFLGYSRHHRPAGAARADETVKVVGLRRRIAENMAASKRAIPHFTYVDEIDVTKLEALRADLNDTRGDRPKLTMLPLLIVALCRTLPDFPMLNARYDDDAGMVTRHGAVHLGLATRTDAGLMVPVIRDAQDRNIWQLAAEITRLATAARAGKAAGAELSGSTLTLTSLGPLGGIVATPVINRPEVAIVAPNKVVERPVVRDGAVAIAKIMNLSISCDHRVVDGYDAARFVAAVRRLLETPALLFVG